MAKDISNHLLQFSITRSSYVENDIHMYLRRPTMLCDVDGLVGRISQRSSFEAANQNQNVRGKT